MTGKNESFPNESFLLLMGIDNSILIKVFIHTLTCDGFRQHKLKGVKRLQVEGGVGGNYGV